MLIYNIKFLKIVWFKAFSIPMATSYVMIGHGGILQNIATNFENKLAKINFKALVRKFLV